MFKTYPQVIHTNKRLKYHVFATYPHKINYTTTIYINVDKKYVYIIFIMYINYFHIIYDIFYMKIYK